MNLSHTSKYAIRILTFMALEEKETYTAKQLIERLMISDKFLRKIMTKLTKAGLVRSIQGRKGGYIFAKKIETIYLLDIIDAMENINKYMDCILGFDECSDKNPCVLHKKWTKIRNQVLEMYKNTNLKDLSNREITKH